MLSKTADPVSIEDIILSHDNRGISGLRPFLPPSHCEDAARFILGSKTGLNKVALITTGFYISAAQAAETDGPPGAIALAGALESLDFEVVYVTDRYGIPLLSCATPEPENMIEFPIADHETSSAFARRLLADFRPAIIIAIERCSFNSDKKYLNMRSVDISDFTAKVDYLFLDQENTLGVGDGGNEIGMGNLAAQIREMPNLPDNPAETRTKKLVISSVSNWGAYGLVAALSLLCQRDLLPSVQWEKDLLADMVARGAVDGVTGERKCTVDAFDLEQNARALTQLKRLVRRDAAAKP